MNPDWRTNLRQNANRSKLVILTFLAIYTLLGLLIDVLRLQSQYPELSVRHAVLMYWNGFAVPWAMISMLGVALISIWITFVFHDKLMLLGTDAHQVGLDENTPLADQKLYHLLEEMKISAGLTYLPKIYIIEADYMNAFASGFSEKSAMIAITRGLMNKLNRQELQAVIAHELSHIRHQDIKLTLMVGVLSNLMLVVVDLLFYNFIYGDSRNKNNVIFAAIVLLRYCLPLISMLLMLFLSRSREYMADAGAVELMRENQSLASALIKISKDYATADYPKVKHEELRQAAYVYHVTGLNSFKSISNLFSTHPSLEQRLAAIGVKISSS